MPFLWLVGIVSAKTILSTHEGQCSYFFSPLPTDSAEEAGFESPRIVVEVKHRTQTMGAPEIRSFIGGRHQEDKGLYVSTGGFTKEAYYEAERSNVPLTLMNIDDVVQAVLDHYEKMDIETQRLLPLKKLYWPA